MSTIASERLYVRHNGPSPVDLRAGGRGLAFGGGGVMATDSDPLPWTLALIDARPDHRTGRREPWLGPVAVFLVGAVWPALRLRKRPAE